LQFNSNLSYNKSTVFWIIFEKSFSNQPKDKIKNHVTTQKHKQSCFEGYKISSFIHVCGYLTLYIFISGCFMEFEFFAQIQGIPANFTLPTPMTRPTTTTNTGVKSTGSRKVSEIAGEKSDLDSLKNRKLRI
jgi:hypothetical protein